MKQTLPIFFMIFALDPYLITKEKIKQDSSISVTVSIVTLICIVVAVIIIRWLFK